MHTDAQQAGDASRPGGWRPSGLVTLLTDFGLRDPYVGVMKGVILSRARELDVIDLSHGVAPQAVAQAAWFLLTSWRYFPVGTVHVAVVDPGVGGSRRILVAEDRGHAFIAPDNGLLGPVLSEDARVVSLDAARFALARPSRTFHGRDLFAPAAAALATGLEPAEAGAATGSWLGVTFPEVVRLDEGRLRTEALFADRFGNLVTPLEGASLGPDPSAWEVEVCGHSLPVVQTYTDAGPGELLALIGSSGTLEVSLREGSAADRLGAGAGTAVLVRRVR